MHFNGILKLRSDIIEISSHTHKQSCSDKIVAPNDFFSYIILANDQFIENIVWFV